jgi:hypothetical protein
MNKTPTDRRSLRQLLLFTVALLAWSIGSADENDPPTRAARLAFIEGTVSFEPAGTTDWVVPYVNRPLATGDQLWSDSDGRAELQLDGSALRVSSNTAVSFLNLADNITQVQLSSGTLIVRVRRLNDNETYEIDTPNLAFSVLRPGLYQLNVDPSGSSTTIVTRDGQGEVTGGGVAYPVNANESDVFSGTDQLVENSQPLPGGDAFDAWSADRDNRWDRSLSARYLSPDVVGYDDLDSYGAWNSTPEYGPVWFPRAPGPGWAPYRNGYWAYVPPWGYTWVDDSPWGFAPFHYGRWAWVNGAWGWVPPPPPGPQYVPAVYAPALVAWVGVGAGIAWFALGPREVYVPSYPVSPAYVNNINISNTTVNTTVVTNIYNTTIVNKTVTNVTYVNRSVPGAVVATSAQAFSSAQPVVRNLAKVDTETLASAPVQPAAPPILPNKQAVLGSQRAAARTPPAAIQKRAVVARTTPPPPPPSFEQRQAAIRSNGGKPLSVAQARQLSPSASRASVKVAAPPHLVARNGAHPGPGNAAATQAGAPRPSQPANARPAPPAAQAQPPRPQAPPAASSSERAQAAKAVHPNEAPPVVKPAAPSTANSVLERQHLQQQQRLTAQQNDERQRLQQQQETEHRQPASQAHPQQLEAQHRSQTAQLLQKQGQEQDAMRSRQEAETRRQNEPPPKAPALEHPTQKKPSAS